jgi:UDP-N-acetylmuramate--alanine ligase
MNARFQHVHFVGIGGIGMCGIAEVLLNLGYRVTGSDLKGSPTTDRLIRLGAGVTLGHAEENVHGADVVVVSTAVAAANPEVRRAHALKIPVIPRAEMLGELMRLKHGIAIGGSHGKTTTTSMTAHVLTEAGLDPTAVIGGRLRTLDSTSRLGKGELLVAEADESDRSFLMLSPVIAVATNVDREHLESYRDLDDLAGSFETFLNKVPFWGLAVVCADDPILATILPRLNRRVVTYGFAKGADLTATSVWTRSHAAGYQLERHGEALGEVHLGVPGRHNALNSLATVAVALELGVPFDRIARSLASFQGADRRLEVKGEARGVLVVDDYGHHPTEIRATLAALREAYGRRIVCVFEPHRYSRVGVLLDEFATAFADAATVLVTDLYAAGEKPLPGLDGAAVAAAIGRAGHPDARYAGSVAAAAALALASVRPGDVLLTLGAGQVTHAAEAALQELAARPEVR